MCTCSVIARDEDTLSVRMKMKELSFLNVVLAYITSGLQNNWLYCRFGSFCELAVVFCSIGHCFSRKQTEPVGMYS